MTPGARIQAAIELLDRIEAPPAGEEALPADAALNSYFRSRRYIGAKDRRAIGDAVFQTLRQRGYIDWLLANEAGLPVENRFRVLWTFAVHHGIDSGELAASCDGGRYHPAPLGADEARRVQLIDVQTNVPPALADQASFPAWIAPEIGRQFPNTRAGGDAWAEMLAFTQAAPTDLRVNTLKATRDEAAAALAAAGVEAVPAQYAPNGLRLASRANIPNLAAYREGWIEVQDESSQLAALLVDAKPGARVLDLCAGGGGKTLALAAAMGNRGSILACDTDAKRLARLAPRLARSGVRIAETRTLGAKAKEKDTLGKFDRVLVDAPCSGSGTWRRHPDAKWRLTPARLDEYRKLQAALLRQAAAAVRPNGSLVYAVCSILPSEGKDQVEAFCAEHPGWRVLPAEKAWRAVLRQEAPFTGPHMLLTPRRHRTDGFFAAILAPP